MEEGGMGGDSTTGGSGMGGSGGSGGAGIAGGGMSGAGGSNAGAAGSAGAGGSGGGVCTDSAIRCALGTCPPGTSAAFYSATSVPVAIPDNDVQNPAFVTIAITTPGLISRIVAQTSIAHEYAGELDIALVTPYGARDLSSDNGGSSENYTNTVLADSGTTAITSEAAPFTGVFRPEQDLATLSGTPLAGNYRLRVADDTNLDAGQVTNFSLGVCQCLASSGQCEFGLACQNGIDDDADGLIDCQEPTCASTPSCPKPESACGDGIDNDADNLTDCDDSSCAWACTALGTSCTGSNRIFAYSATNLPQTISPAGAVRIPAPIFASTGGSVVLAAVRFNATHDYDGDLSLVMSSTGTVYRTLTSSNGSDGEDYVDTVFIDSATTSITAGTAPFTGQFRPEDLLSAWIGQPALGVWQADLFDGLELDGGIFEDLSLALCVTP
jgi:subtilisin-like proprotein convertase family protein